MSISEYMRGCPHCAGTGYVYDDKMLGAHLAGKRKAQKIGQNDMATALGITSAYLCDLEYGRRHWSAKRAAEYVMVLAAKRKGNE